MTTTAIHRTKPVFSASTVRDAIAQALTEIKDQDNLTDDDLGRVLGKSADQAAKYRTGLAEMGSYSFAAAKREWNGRFTGYYDRLCVESRPSAPNDQHHQTSILQAACALSVALEDGTITAEEVRANRSTLENARDAINEQLSKLVQAVGL